MPLPPQTHQILQSLISSIISLQTTGGSAASRRQYSWLFQDLPDKRDYADYYILIKEPRCLNGVMDSLKKGIYSTPQGVAYDLFLIWSNARDYNQQGSQVYNDADKLEAHMQKLWKEKTPPLPPFASLPRPGTLPPTPSSSKTAESSSSGEPKAKRIKIKSTSLIGGGAGTNTPIIRRAELPPRAAPVPPPASATAPVASGSGSSLTLKLGGLRAGASASPAPPPPADTKPSLSNKIILPVPASQSTSIASPTATPVEATTADPSSLSAGEDGSRKRAREDSQEGTTAGGKKETRKERRAREKAAKAAAREEGPAAAATPTATASEAVASPEATIAPTAPVPLPMPGLPDEESGWMSVEDAGPDPTTRYLEILNAIRDLKDPNGRPLAGPILRVPDPALRPDYYNLVKNPIALSLIEEKINASQYPTPESFDRDLQHLFTVAKIFIRPESPGTVYSDLVILQRLYFELTKHRSPLSPSPAVTPSGALSSVPTGPGNVQMNNASNPARAESPGTMGESGESGLGGLASPGTKSIASTRPAVKDRTFLDGINFKGDVLKVGDWIHIMNPDNPGKPVIAQIFKVYKKADSPQRCLSVCWYYRPEETTHPATRQFYEHEVFKTSNFVDHNVEDFVSRCFVLFFTKYVRGRPRTSSGFSALNPLYVCEHRYKDEFKSFKKIKNWASCVPEEIRAHEYDFETWKDGRIDALKRIQSPFVRGVSDGPGGIGESLEGEEEDQLKYHFMPGGEVATKEKLRAAREAEEESRREEVRKSALYGGNSQAGAQPLLAGQPRAQSQTPAAVVVSTLAESAIKSESFQPLPLEIQSKFRADASGDLLWFAAPALVLPPPKRATHSSAYLKWKESKEKRVNGVNGAITNGLEDVEMQDVVEA